MVLVTGGAGLIGRELINQLLLKGEKVVAIYNRTPLSGFSTKDVKQINCNILDVVGLEQAMQGIEKVYHCAGVVKFSSANRKEMFAVNVEGTANIVNIALETGIKKLIHVSSVAALDRLREDRPVDETMHWKDDPNNSNYGKSKYLGEMEVWRGIGEGLNAAIVNPVIVLGPGDWNSSSTAIFKSIYDGFPWYSNGISGFVDVRDVAKAMIALMESDISSERFIISAENRTYEDLFKLIARTFGKKEPSKKVTPFLAGIVWRLEAIRSIITSKEPLVTKETSVAALAKTNFDNGKLKKFLPEFTYRTIEETVTHTCNILQQTVNNP